MHYYDHDIQKEQIKARIEECRDILQDIEDELNTTFFDTQAQNIVAYDAIIDKLKTLKCIADSTELEIDDMKAFEIEECNQPI